MRKRWVWIGGLVLAGLVAGLTAYANRPVPWRTRVLAAYKPPEARKPGAMTPEFWAVHDRISGDILQRPNWGQAELVELRRVLDLPVDWKHVGGPPETRTREATIQYSIYSEAMNAIDLRVDSHAPMDPDVRQAFMEMYIGLLDDPVPQQRNAGIAYVTQLGLIDHPGPVRSKVEAMRSDPDPEVAANAARQLEWRDLLRSKGRIK